VETQQVVYIVAWWIFQTLVGAVIGKSKGRLDSGVFWSFLLGPIGWLIVALMSDLRQKCPECGGVVVAGARKCKNCGSVIGSPASSPRTEMTGTASPVVRTRWWFVPLTIVFTMLLFLGLLTLLGSLF
jgi:hypothetical protein